MRILVPLTSCLTAALLLIAPAHASIVPETVQQRLQQQLDHWRSFSGFPGATFGFCLPNGQCDVIATGLADLEKQQVMPVTAQMSAGSTGKTIALALAMQLVEQGKLQLDQKASHYLGHLDWFARLPNAADFTVRQLMNHSSGLVRYEYKPEFTSALTANPDKHWQPKELLSFLFDSKAPFAAGQGWDYSDSNYIVLGLILEQLTGKAFYDAAQAAVLDPLHLVSIQPQAKPELPQLVQGYAGPDNAFGEKPLMMQNGKMIINPQFEWTGGGYMANSKELARWAQSLYQGKVFSATLLPQVFDGLAAPLLGDGVRYGLGVIIRQDKLGLSYGHSGFFPGYLTNMLYLPDSGLAVAIQFNSSESTKLQGTTLHQVISSFVEILQQHLNHQNKKTAA